jgi:hypothetical protein
LRIAATGGAPLQRRQPTSRAAHPRARRIQIIGGPIDHLIELADGFVVIDHKSFPGLIEIDGERLLDFAGQASVYARELERVPGAPAGNIGCINQSRR